MQFMPIHTEGKRKFSLTFATFLRFRSVCIDLTFIPECDLSLCTIQPLPEGTFFGRSPPINGLYNINTHYNYQVFSDDHLF